MQAALNGRWSYRSFSQSAAVLTNGRVDFANLVQPWTPSAAELNVTTDETGRVKGTLRFSPKIALEISGRIVHGTGNVPDAVELTGEGHGSVNRIKGFFIPDSTHIVGTIVAESHDLAQKPDGTSGPFVLFPLDVEVD